MGERAVDEERAALLALLDERPAMFNERAGKTSWSTIASEVSLRGSALALWHGLHPPTEPTLDLQGSVGADKKRSRLDIAWRQLTDWDSPDFRMVTVLDEDYPVALRGIHQMPPLLFVKGDLRADEVGISIVGTRNPTERGRTIAANLAEALVQRQVSVISGLAAGIDGAAHEATLRAGGRPIGVLGTGITKIYPAAHRDLHDRVAANGALVSQFLPDAPPTKQSFPMRNVTMSGLGRASIIVEAGEHSGTRIQARAGAEHGRPVILTDFVVKATTWGRAIKDRPGVYVAGSTAEVIGIVEQLLHDSGQADVLKPPTGQSDSH